MRQVRLADGRLSPCRLLAVLPPANRQVRMWSSAIPQTPPLHFHQYLTLGPLTNMSWRRMVLCAVVNGCFAGAGSATPVFYDVTVNTTSVSGTTGSFDFNFNPGPLTTQAADLQILAFASTGALGGTSCPCGTGDVGGQLPAAVTFDNGTALNDYFETFTFGSTLSFEVSLYGPALSSPDGISASGSTFAFSMFSDAAGTAPTLTSD